MIRENNKTGKIRSVDIERGGIDGMREEHFDRIEGDCFVISDCDVFETISIPFHTKFISCGFNYIESLVLPDAIKGVWCCFNPLRYIELPDSLERLDCRSTCLTSLDLPEGFKELDCRNTYIESLYLPLSIERLYCDNTLNIENFNEVIEYNPDIDLRMEDEELPFNRSYISEFFV